MFIHKGLYAFTRLPFDVSFAPSIFQKIIEHLLQCIFGVVLYFDDTFTICIQISLWTYQTPCFLHANFTIFVNNIERRTSRRQVTRLLQVSFLLGPSVRRSIHCCNPSECITTTRNLFQHMTWQLWISYNTSQCLACCNELLLAITVFPTTSTL